MHQNDRRGWVSQTAYYRQFVKSPHSNKYVGQGVYTLPSVSVSMFYSYNSVAVSPLAKRCAVCTAESLPVRLRTSVAQRAKPTIS